MIKRLVCNLYFFQNPIEKHTRENLRTFAASPGTEHINEIEKSIDKFIELGLEDKGDLSKAQDAFDYKTDRKSKLLRRCKISVIIAVLQ